MAEYLILIYEDENAYATASPDVFQEVMEAHNRFAQQVGRRAASSSPATPSSRPPPRPPSAATS